MKLTILIAAIIGYPSFVALAQSELASYLSGALLGAAALYFREWLLK